MSTRSSPPLQKRRVVVVSVYLSQVHPPPPCSTQCHHYHRLQRLELLAAGNVDDHQYTFSLQRQCLLASNASCIPQLSSSFHNLSGVSELIQVLFVPFPNQWVHERVVGGMQATV